MEKRWVRKRNGRLQVFNRQKIRSSVVNAGATQKQARHVANTITESVRVCKLCRDINGKKEVSSARLSNTVTSELFKINRNAADRYSKYRNLTQKPPSGRAIFTTPTQPRERKRETNETTRLRYTNQMNTLFSQITSINQQAHNATSRIENLNDRIHSLPTRITRIRQGNYQVSTHLESDQVALSERWSNLSPDLRSTTYQRRDTVQSKTQDLQRALTQTQRRTDYNLGNLGSIESSLSELRRNLSEIEGFVASSISPLEKKYQSIDTDLRMAESTVTLVSQASFPWMERETPIIATKVKDLNNNLDGILTLTNLRFILEHEKEIVLKKRLFIVTEKKNVREVALQKPIGMVTRLTKGKVGLLKGSGLFVEFAPESGIPEMKFDTKGHEADWMAQRYNYIISGQADEELVTVTPESTPGQKAPQLVACHVCGAPYKEQIYRGQTSVTCQYCGAVIALK